MHRSLGRPSLLELALMLEAHGGNAATLIYAYRGRHGLAADWPTADVWPYFAHYINALERAVRAYLDNSVRHNRDGLLAAVASLPQPPSSLVDALYNLAFGSAKTERRPAQDALDNLPGKEARIIAALADGRAEVRTVAAQWLGRLRHAPALPALEAAVLKEKNDLAKGALLDALEALGQPLDRFLDRKTYMAEAAKGVAKGLPKELDWFPWSALPAVHWADSGESVPGDTLRWLLAHAVKQKSAEPNAVLRRFCGMFEPRGREALGQLVLDTWLHEDVRPIPPEEALRLAAGQAQQTWNWMQQAPQYHQDNPLFGRSVAELTAMFLPRHQRTPVGSAVSSKGLLAVAAACAGAGAAAPAARYLKDWYGSRAAQGKALIAMLAWIEHPSATQLMLSIGSRFRTKSFQEEATRQAEALAERRNWTLAELADRTIPSAGFDENGELELSYGNRAFGARLLPDFKIELYNPEGKKIAALPEPRQDDDAELAADAKKAYSAAKKDLKKIVELQTERLYEALCTERDWPAADWELYLNRHPVMRRLVQRLVWVEMREGKPAQTFRPLDDGTLTDREDNAVTVAPEARVRLAHDSLLPPEEVAQWRGHLADYKVAPLFQQLGRGGYALPEGRANDTAIEDYEGHLIDSFALRGRAVKLGYVRGPTEDGGWFHVYEKRFINLGI
ncbi:MAG TPA: DUF4132 domain-containing protein, partial [Nevskia sp.]|nr:DUF4132 domain-containing protein [Nevskia sp.]